MQRGWLRHYATSRKVADWNPDEVIAFFSIYLILTTALLSGVDSDSTRTEYQEYSSGQKATGS
jgi:hypothetical protein